MTTVATMPTPAAEAPAAKVAQTKVRLTACSVMLCAYDRYLHWHESWGRASHFCAAAK